MEDATGGLVFGHNRTRSMREVVHLGVILSNNNYKRYPLRSLFVFLFCFCWGFFFGCQNDFDFTYVFDLLTGLFQSSDYRLGSQLLKSNNDADKIAFLQKIFEV